jgi:hypothetical protein
LSDIVLGSIDWARARRVFEFLLLARSKHTRQAVPGCFNDFGKDSEIYKVLHGLLEMDNPHCPQTLDVPIMKRDKDAATHRLRNSEYIIFASYIFLI